MMPTTTWSLMMPKTGISRFGYGINKPLVFIGFRALLTAHPSVIKESMHESMLTRLEWKKGHRSIGMHERKISQPVWPTPQSPSLLGGSDIHTDFDRADFLLELFMYHLMQCKKIV